MGPCLTHACARDHRFAGNSCRHVDLGKKALDKEALDAHTVSAEGAVPSPYPRPPPRGTWTALLRGSAARALDATVARRPGRQLLSVRRALVKLPAGCTPGTCLHLAAPDSAGDPQRTIYRVVVPSLATSLLWVELPDEAGPDPMEAEHPPPSWASLDDASDWVKAIVDPGAIPSAGAAKEAWQFITASASDWQKADLM